MQQLENSSSDIEPVPELSAEQFMKLAAEQTLQNNPKFALDLIEQAIKQDPQFGPAWQGKAILLFQLDRPQEALLALERSIIYSSTEDKQNLLIFKGVLEMALGNFEFARIAIEDALAINRDRPFARYVYAMVFAAKGDKSEMIAQLKTAIDLAPGFRQMALEDKVFSPYWTDSDFLRLVQ